MRLLPDQASNFAPEIDYIFYVILGLSIFFAIGVVIALMYFGVKYRAGNKVDRSRPPYHNTKLELAWSVIPFLIGVPIFVWSAKVFIEMYSPKNTANSLNISVVGKQWMWHIQHPTGQRENNELHIPLGRDVKLTMISQDVIHSFFVPDFRVKKDVLPGRFTTVWFRPTKVGKYYLFCAEYCGTDHAKMGGYVYVMQPEDYEKWLHNSQWGMNVGKAPETMAERGHRLFVSRGCEGCHGVGKEGTAPSLLGLYGKERVLSDGRRIVADEDYIRRAIFEPDVMTVQGYQKLMPSFSGQLDEQQIFEIISYIRSLTTTLPSGQLKAEGQRTALVTEAAKPDAASKSEGNQ